MLSTMDNMESARNSVRVCTWFFWKWYHQQNTVLLSVRHGYEKPAGYTDTDTTDTDTDDHFCIRGQILIHIHDIRTRRGGYLLPI